MVSGVHCYYLEVSCQANCFCEDDQSFISSMFNIFFPVFSGLQFYHDMSRFWLFLFVLDYLIFVFVSFINSEKLPVIIYLYTPSHHFLYPFIKEIQKGKT